MIDWLSKLKHPTEHIIGHIWDGFLRVKWPNQHTGIQITQIKHNKLNPGLVASYNLRPGNAVGLFW